MGWGMQTSLALCLPLGDDPWVRKIPWRRARQPTPVFLRGESLGQRSLVGYSVVHRVAKSRTQLKQLSKRARRAALLVTTISLAQDRLGIPNGFTDHPPNQ